MLRCYSLQEILLKRAADLVEALYGNPHSNQVNYRNYKNRNYVLMYSFICEFRLPMAREPMSEEANCFQLFE